MAGDLIALRLQQGLAAADAVVFVASAESAGRGRVNELPQPVLPGSLAWQSCLAECRSPPGQAA